MVCSRKGWQRGGHGAAPEKCADPIVASAAVIVGIQTIVSRNVSPLDMAVVSVCSIHGGRTDNRIEDDVTLDGSFRTFHRETRTLIMERLRWIAADCAQGYDCTATVVFSDETPAVVNDASLLGAATRAANAVGCVVRPDLAMISEDFSAYCERVPSFFFFLGSGENENSAPLHSANYRAHPDAALYGAALLACAAIEAVRRRNKERSVNRTRRERSARRVKRLRFGCMPIIDREHAGTETKESSGRNGGFPLLPLLFRLCGYAAVT